MSDHDVTDANIRVAIETGTLRGGVRAGIVHWLGIPHT